MVVNLQANAFLAIKHLDVFLAIVFDKLVHGWVRLEGGDVNLERVDCAHRKVNAYCLRYRKLFHFVPNSLEVLCYRVTGRLNDETD